MTKWWAKVDELKRIGLNQALQNVRLVPVGDELEIYSDESSANVVTHDQARIYAWSAEWSRLGFPIVQTPHRFAAALMCTATPPMDDGDIRPPWPYFMIKVPSGLLSIADSDGRQRDIEHIGCTYHAGHWGINAFTPETLLAVPWSSTEFLRDAKLADLDSTGVVFPEQHEMALDSQDERVFLCLARLILNTCLAFSDPLNVREVGKGHTKKASVSLARAALEPPPHRLFELGRPVTVDCREYVRSYVTGDRARLAVRLLVRGFWRNQPHGPGRELRRQQWIEPYWKGDVGAPILLRPHELRRTH